jgi:hypothetical protein
MSVNAISVDSQSRRNKSTMVFHFGESGKIVLHCMELLLTPTQKRLPINYISRTTTISMGFFEIDL